MICKMCGESIIHEDEVREYTCPTCGGVGLECCFPAGNGTECLSCEEGFNDDNEIEADE